MKHVAPSPSSLTSIYPLTLWHHLIPIIIFNVLYIYTHLEIVKGRREHSPPGHRRGAERWPGGGLCLSPPSRFFLCVSVQIIGTYICDRSTYLGHEIIIRIYVGRGGFVFMDNSRYWAKTCICVLEPALPILLSQVCALSEPL